MDVWNQIWPSKLPPLTILGIRVWAVRKGNGLCHISVLMRTYTGREKDKIFLSTCRLARWVKERSAKCIHEPFTEDGKISSLQESNETDWAARRLWKRSGGPEHGRVLVLRKAATGRNSECWDTRDSHTRCVKDKLYNTEWKTAWFLFYCCIAYNEL